MHEEQITQVAKVLEEWNPLGGAANTIDELDRYRYEAIDIISTAEMLSGPNKVKDAISQVLTEAFNKMRQRRSSCWRVRMIYPAGGTS